MKKTKSKTGFTIIEVVLVLAIAGLIMLMVFVALPAMQRSQRDTDRKSRYSLTITAITNYTSDNRGALPTTATALQGYLDDDVTDPGSGTQYTSAAGIRFVNPTSTQLTTAEAVKGVQVSGTGVTEDNPIIIVTARDCDGTVKGARHYALVGYLETGVYCQAN